MIDVFKANEADLLEEIAKGDVSNSDENHIGSKRIVLVMSAKNVKASEASKILAKHGGWTEKKRLRIYKYYTRNKDKYIKLKKI